MSELLARLRAWWAPTLTVPAFAPEPAAPAPSFAGVVLREGIPIVVSVRGVECPVVPGVATMGEIAETLGEIEMLPEATGARGFAW